MSEDDSIDLEIAHDRMVEAIEERVRSQTIADYSTGLMFFDTFEDYEKSK